MTQFQQWFTEALEAGVLDPNAMGVATVGDDGQPSLRMVLLKHFDATGLRLLHQPRKPQGAGDRQQLPAWRCCSTGRRSAGRCASPASATRVSAAESLRYFLTRPRDSQIGAWVSDQSRVVEGREFLESRFAEIKARFAAGEVPLPAFWGGYRVAIHTVEFWQARENRLHDRFLYSPAGTGWTISRLAP